MTRVACVFARTNKAQVLDWLVERQKKAVAKYTNKDPRVAAFIILDDVIADQKIIRWNSDLQRFFVEGRHLAITVFIASQYLKGVGPVRNQTLPKIPFYALLLLRLSPCFQQAGTKT